MRIRLPLVAFSCVAIVTLALYACSESNPTSPADVQTSDAAVQKVQFAKGGPKPSLPADCAQGQYIQWDGAAFVCVDAPPISGWEIVDQLYTTETHDMFAWCPVGKKILGGGYSSPVTYTYIRNSRPFKHWTEDRWGWRVEWRSTPDCCFEVYAICAD